MMKKIVLIVAGVGIVSLLGMVGSMMWGSYIMTDGWRDYVSFCDNYIEKIEAYRLQYHMYPNDLSVFVKPRGYRRYDPKKCKYFKEDDNYYMLFTSDGFRDQCYDTVGKIWKKC